MVARRHLRRAAQLLSPGRASDRPQATLEAFQLRVIQVHHHASEHEFELCHIVVDQQQQLREIDTDLTSISTTGSFASSGRWKKPRPPSGSRFPRRCTAGASFPCLRARSRCCGSIAALLEMRFAVGLGKPDDDTLLLGNADGSPTRPSHLTTVWCWACKSLKLPQVSLHALRHTHASALIAAGLDVLAAGAWGMPTRPSRSTSTGTCSRGMTRPQPWRSMR